MGVSERFACRVTGQANRATQRQEPVSTVVADPDGPKADAPNLVWAVDFQSDATTTTADGTARSVTRRQRSTLPPAPTDETPE